MAITCLRTNIRIYKTCKYMYNIIVQTVVYKWLVYGTSCTGTSLSFSLSLLLELYSYSFIGKRRGRAGGARLLKS